MKKFNYNEPEFKVVLTSAEDILTLSNPDESNNGFETGFLPLLGSGSGGGAVLGG